MAGWTDVGAEHDFTAPRVVVVGDAQILIVPLDGALHACDAICPHKFANLVEGAFADGCVTCPVHEGTFHIITGEPAAGCEWAGQLPTFPLRIRAGRVEVDHP